MTFPSPDGAKQSKIMLMSLKYLFASARRPHLRIKVINVAFDVQNYFHYWQFTSVSAVQ